MRGAGDLFCIAGGRSRSWAEFAGDVAALRPRLGGADAVCNLCRDRYAYAVGLAAAMANGQTTVLPHSTAPRALAAALDGAEAPLVLGGEAAPEGSARRLARLPDGAGRADPAPLLADLEAAGGEIHVFTSGSTGHPVRHRKRWRTLAGGAGVTEGVIAAAGLAETPFAILGTTPHQHMYGLEAAVFSGLAFGRTLHRGTVFYPADLEAAALELRAAGLAGAVLATSPTHLKFLEHAVCAVPELRAVISATAPLPESLAARIEGAAIPVFEIYGSTETGSVAIRRTVEGPDWTPLAGFSLETRPEGSTAEAPHLDGPVLLGDLLSISPTGRFRLLGRVGDMVTVAGKRTSLGTLNAVAAETPGLADAVVLRERRDAGDWLGVVAVPAPGGASETELRAAIRAQFRAHLDPVFQPSRIQFAAALPRSGTGKISAADQSALLAALLTP